mmetsp:Transcript_9621/g.16903  ORF Transcript_9621/g.16903 Transcript_9621/m.16903 type:complete len:382 (+) Transcript_9621:370-1515(+)
MPSPSPTQENLKPKACVECYRLKRQCVFEEGTDKCTRCKQESRDCVLRVLFKGKVRVAGPELAQEVGAEAYKLLTILDEAKDIDRQREAVAGWINAARALGNNIPPVYLKWLVVNLYWLAKVKQNVARMNNVAGLALACNINLLQTGDSVSLEDRAYFDSKVAEMMIEPEHGAAIGVVIALGVRRVLTTRNWEQNFSSQKDIEKEFVAPLKDAWRVFCVNEEDGQELLSISLMHALSQRYATGNPPEIDVVAILPRRAPIRDKYGNLYMANLKLRIILVRVVLMSIVVTFENVEQSHPDHLRQGLYAYPTPPWEQQLIDEGDYPHTVPVEAPPPPAHHICTFAQDHDFAETTLDPPSSVDNDLLNGVKQYFDDGENWKQPY